MINKPQDNDTELSRCERHSGGVKGVLLSQARAPRGGERHPGVRGRPGGLPVGCHDASGGIGFVKRAAARALEVTSASRTLVFMFLLALALTWD